MHIYVYINTHLSLLRVGTYSLQRPDCLMFGAVLAEFKNLNSDCTAHQASRRESVATS